MNQDVGVSINIFSLRKSIYLVTKRVLDILLSLVGIIFLIPLCIIVKISYLLNKDNGSIFFTQDRIGKNGKIFKLYKFRSMVLNADKILEDMLRNDKKLAYEYNKNKKLKDDPRITKMGNILRKTSLDELPQVINILLGHMSFIGNRPYLPREKEDMKESYDEIVSTKPGLTGLWQVSGRSDISFKNRCKLEAYYSNNFGFIMDMKIFLKTFYVVFKMMGAK